MSIAENKAVDRRLIEEALNQGDLAVVEELIATEFVDHDGPPGMRDGPNGFKAAVIAWRTAFPNLQVTIEEQVSEGDRVGHRVSMRGIHTGDLFGIPPTGKSVVSEGVHLIRLAGGQLVEHWGINDALGML